MFEVLSNDKKFQDFCIRNEAMDAMKLILVEPILWHL